MVAILYTVVVFDRIRARISGSRTSALAMATRCFCPPDICTPLSPTGVLNPSGNLNNFTVESFLIVR